MAGLFIDSRVAVWRLGWNLELFTIFYYGAIATGATFCLLLCADSKGGRIYTRMLNPLGLIFVVVLEALVLRTEILSWNNTWNGLDNTAILLLYVG
ncbi:hypothetical protein SLE2022_288230 [Rubroshorea leprosula]